MTEWHHWSGEAGGTVGYSEHRAGGGGGAQHARVMEGWRDSEGPEITKAATSDNCRQNRAIV